MREELMKKAEHEEIFWPSKEIREKAWIKSDAIYKKAEKNPVKFWSKLAEEGISWYKKWKKAYVERLPYFKWFVGGKLNACFNAVDRHLATKKNKAAIIWEPEPLEERNRVLTYNQLFIEVNKFANVLKDLGVKKGDVVGIYLPLIPEAHIAMLACARIGAIHNVVFSAFSPEALKYRLKETEARVLITCDGYYRRGKLINLKGQADEGIKDTRVEKLVVVKRAGNEVSWVDDRDFWWHELTKKVEAYCKPEAMDSEDTLFILYTSGTTGFPKGILHSTGGYLTQAYWTAKWDFDLHDEDIFWCVPPNTDIITNLGPKAISKIKSGDFVLSHKGNFVKVSNVLERPYKGELIKINTYYSHEPILITPNHKILVSKNKVGPFEWVPASEIKKGYYLLFPIIKGAQGYKRKLKIIDLLDQKKHFYKIKKGKIFSTKGKHRIPSQIKINEDFIRLCGYYVAGGSRDRNGFYFNFGKHEKSYIEEVKNLIKKIFNLEAKVKISHKWAAPVYVTSTILSELFEKLFGKRAEEKKLPEWLILLPNRLLTEFVKGFWCGDGNQSNEGFEFNTTSKTLAFQLKMILLKLGVIPSLRLCKVDKDKVRYVNGRKFTYKHDIYKITVTGTSLSKISEILGINHPFLTQRSKTYHRGKITGKFLWTKVTSVSKEDYEGLVCNLKTESETYATSAFLVHNCTADIAWITGHTYACYGPLLNGATLLIYEGAPDFPQPDRWCEIIEKYGVTVFYTAPTAIRMFIKFDGKWVGKHNLSSLRILGSVGEPINREAWLWYFNEVGKAKCPIVDTWWQTETGGALINSLPGIGPFIPAVAGRSFPGTRHEVVDEKGNVLPPGKEGNLVQLSPFAPGMLRGIYKNHEKYFETYWEKYGDKYFTGDGAWKDEKGNFRLTGRVDDVMKVAGHRISTAELEDAIARHQAVAECAVVSMPHEIKGEAPVAFVILKEAKPSEALQEELVKQVEKFIGPIARPSKIIFVDDLPKTRSGKIIRRLLKKLLLNEELGDVSTLANPESLEKIKKVITA